MVSFSVRKDEPIAEGAEEGRRDAEGEEGEEGLREPLAAAASEGLEERVVLAAAAAREGSPFEADVERGAGLVRMGFLAMESV